MQDNRQPISHRSDWSLSLLHQTLSLLVLTTLILGACLTILLAACTAQSSPGAQTPSATHTSAGISTATSTTSNNQIPTVHMGVDDFLQSSITIPKGSKLQLVDDGPYVHVLFNGMWQNNQIHIKTEPGAPTVNRLIVKGNSVEIGPFSIAGTFHIICVVHPGMNLTITVQ
jgi:plastocyanin